MDTEDGQFFIKVGVGETGGTSPVITQDIAS